MSTTSDQELSIGRQIVVGGQMLFVAFGALVLVPILTGLNPSVALFTAGVGTLLFQLVTKRSVPVFLASSFAFIAPIIYGVQTWGLAGTMSGLVAAGLVYILLSLLVRVKGQDIIDRILPPVVVGPVIMVIGLNLAPVAVNMALGKTGDGSAQLVTQNTAMIVAGISLAATILTALMTKGLLRLLPILVGILAGTIAGYALGIVDFSKVANAPLFAVPAFTLPEFNLDAILFILPVAIAPAIEHIGDMAAISNVAGKNYLERPGLKNTLLGDGIATSFAAFLGGPPNTTYSEVTGAVALTKCFNPAIMTFAAIWAIVLAFSGTLGAVLGSIPVPVMGGILVILFGAIAVVGISTLVKVGDDLLEPRNLMLIAIVLVCGLGGLELGTKEFAMKGIGLSAIVAIVLNAILPRGEKR